MDARRRVSAMSLDAAKQQSSTMVRGSVGALSGGACVASSLCGDALLTGRSARCKSGNVSAFSSPGPVSLGHRQRKVWSSRVRVAPWPENVMSAGAVLDSPLPAASP
ncbi:MAG: hypothetical protein R3F14_09800 [Polyangiaceae bacterium]